VGIRNALLVHVYIKCVCFMIFVFFLTIHCLTPTEDMLFDATIGVEDLKKTIAQGVNLEVRNSSGFTPLLSACLSGDTLRAEALIEAGAAIEAAMPPPDKRTPLHLAIASSNQRGSADIVGLLLERGANLNSVEQRGNYPIHQLLRVDDVKVRMRVLTSLLLFGVDINQKGEDGNTILHMFIKKFDYPAVIALRDLYGIELDLTVRNNAGLTPIEYANSFIFTDIVELLREKPKIIGLTDANTNIYDANGLTVLMHATLAGKQELVRELIEQHRANVDLPGKNPFGFTALEIALIRGDWPMASLLLSKKALISAPDARGKTAFNNLTVIRDLGRKTAALDLLVKAGGDVNMQDGQGNTLLHDVARRNDIPLLEYIAKTYKGRFNSSIKNKKYDTPADIARKRGYTKISTLLEQLK
jgi:ankyrin repeat protein